MVKRSMGLYRVWAALVVLCCFSIVSAARADPVPRDETGFTSYVAAALQRAVPGGKVTFAGPLSLRVDAPTGKNTAYLNNLYRECQTHVDRCDELVAPWIDQMSSRYIEKDPPLDRAALRIVVRPESYVEQLRRVQKDEPIDVARPVSQALFRRTPDGFEEFHQ